jgi:NAD(P)-dependent dehydrogenase (short-subunit alcohol dehydrogenase family)
LCIVRAEPLAHPKADQEHDEEVDDQWDGDLYDIERQPHNDIAFQREHHQNSEEQRNQRERAYPRDEARPITNAFLPALKEAGAGSIVNITSGTSAPPAGILLHYWAAKSALNSYSRGIAQELAPSKIRVNVISPGLIATPGANDVQAVLVKALGIPAEQIFKVPMGRIGQPEELAEVAAFLLSERASYITGQIYHVDGGIN